MGGWEYGGGAAGGAERWACMSAASSTGCEPTRLEARHSWRPPPVAWLALHAARPCARLRRLGDAACRCMPGSRLTRSASFAAASSGEDLMKSRNLGSTSRPLRRVDDKRGQCRSRHGQQLRLCVGSPHAKGTCLQSPGSKVCALFAPKHALTSAASPRRCPAPAAGTSLQAWTVDAAPLGNRVAERVASRQGTRVARRCLRHKRPSWFVAFCSASAQGRTLKVVLDRAAVHNPLPRLQLLQDRARCSRGKRAQDLPAGRGRVRLVQSGCAAHAASPLSKWLVGAQAAFSVGRMPG